MRVVSSFLADVEEFLSALPPRNLATLRHVMQHVGFLLCHQRLLKVRLSVGQQSQSRQASTTVNIDRLDDPRLILTILGQVLLRPAWSRLVLLASPDSELHRLVALERLFEHFNQSPGVGTAGARSRSIRSG